MNTYMRFFTVAAIVFAVSFKVAAQTIICEKQGAPVEASGLDAGMASIVFRSTLGDWIIKQKQKHDGDVECRYHKEGKENVYEFLVDVSKASERTYTLNRPGNLITGECVVKGLRKGYRVIYNLSEQAEDNLQRIEANQVEGGSFFEENSACVEITTEIKNLTLTTGWQVKESAAPNGARILEAFVNLQDLNNKKAELDSLNTLLTKKKEECERLYKAYFAKVDRVENADNDTIMLKNAEREIKALELEVAKADSIYKRFATLTIGGAGIKPLSIDLTDLALKKLYRYTVKALTESFDDLLRSARSYRDGKNSHTEFGYYEAGRLAYENAMRHKDAPHSQLESLQDELNQFLDVRQYIWYLHRAQVLADSVEQEQGTEAEGVYKNLMVRCNVAKKIMQLYPEIEGVQEIYNSTHLRLSAHPLYKNRMTETVTVQRQVISGKVVKGPSFLFNVSGLRVYAVSFSGKVKNSDYKKEIGRIRQDGSFRIVLTEPTKYIYIEGEKVSRPITPDTSEMGTLVLER